MLLKPKEDDDAIPKFDRGWAVHSVPRLADVGHETMRLQEHFATALRGMLTQIRRLGNVPILWNHSLALALDKKQGDGPAFQRLVHRLDPMSKCFYRQLKRRQRRDAPMIPPQHFGCLPGRRREEAVTVRLCLSHRLRRHGRSHFTTMYDLKNAFAATKQAHLLETDSLYYSAPNAALLAQTCDPALITVQAMDGSLTLAMVLFKGINRRRSSS